MFLHQFFIFSVFFLIKDWMPYFTFMCIVHPFCGHKVYITFYKP